MRTRVWCTMLMLSGLAMACGDQTTEVVPERNVPGDVALATTSTEDGLSITTDKDDYQPGDTVWFTGAGWAAGDTLDILLEDEPTTHAPHSWWVPVGELGTFRDSTYVVDVGDLGVTFTLTATSRITGRSLVVQFTDGRMLVSVLLNGTSSPITVAPGATISATVTVTTFSQAGTGNDNWRGTSWRVATTDGSRTCNNHPDHIGAGTYTEVFNITAPSTAGTFSAFFVAHQGDDCPPGNASTVLALTNGVVVEHPTTTALTATPASPQQFGTAVTFEAKVTRTSGGAPVTAGIVRFFDGGTSSSTPPSCFNLVGATQIGADQTPDADGKAQVTTGALDVGSHTVRACYFGVTAQFGRSEASLSYTIDPAVAGTTLAAAPATGTFGGTANLSATLMSGSSPVEGKTISFTLNGNPACGVSGKPACPTTDGDGVAALPNASLAGIGAGDYPSGVGASFAGDATHTSATATASLTVQKADQTITFAALANKTFGDAPFDVSATASSNLPVTFALGSGSTGCTLSGTTVTLVGATPTGQFCIIVAQQAGNDDYNPAEDVSRSFTIAKAPTTTVVASSQSPTVFGEPVTFTATVSATPSGLSGTVTFKNGSTTLGTGALTCGATCTASLTTAALPTGTHTGITAAYGGNANFEASTSAAITQVVNPAATSTALTASAYTATYGDEDVTFTANVTANAPSTATVDEGSVKFTVKQGATEIGTVSGSVANGAATADFPLFGVNAGGYSVEADYQPAASDPNFLASSDPTPASLTVDRAPTSTAIESLSSAPYYVNGAVTVTFSVAPTNAAGQFASPPSGTVQVNNSSAPCSAALPATSCAYTPTTVGNHDLTASYAGDGNYLPSSSSPAVRITVAYKFLGFFAPVDRPNTYNLSKAGQSIPLKWRLLDANDQPVSNLTAVNVTINSLNCSNSTVTDLIEEYAPGASGLQNHGDGYYQFNWKTPAGYAQTCKNIGLDFGNGYVERALANFNFKK